MQARVGDGLRGLVGQAAQQRALVRAELAHAVERHARDGADDLVVADQAGAHQRAQAEAPHQFRVAQTFDGLQVQNDEPIAQRAAHDVQRLAALERAALRGEFRRQPVDARCGEPFAVLVVQVDADDGHVEGACDLLDQQVEHVVEIELGVEARGAAQERFSARRFVTNAVCGAPALGLSPCRGDVRG